MSHDAGFASNDAQFSKWAFVEAPNAWSLNMQAKPLVQRDDRNVETDKVIKEFN